MMVVVMVVVVVVVVEETLQHLIPFSRNGSRKLTTFT
jgi:hypothetical protein